MTDERPTHLDIFSGIGGFALAAQWAGFRTVEFCEIEPYAQRVLAQNFGAGSKSDSSSKRNDDVNGCRSVKCWSNIFTLDGAHYRGVSLLTGGFPCQPFSVAGKRRGAADDRHLWPEMLRVIAEARPAWVLGENVPGFIPMELDNVLSQLEGIGYACRPFVIPACAVDARHRRDRLWIVGRDVADTSGGRFRGSGGRKVQLARGTETKRGGKAVADSSQFTEREPAAQANTVAVSGRARLESGGGSRWLPEPRVGRVAHGIPARVDRLKGLGNAIVPQVAFEILREIRRQLI